MSRLVDPCCSGLKTSLSLKNPWVVGFADVKAGTNGESKGITVEMGTREQMSIRPWLAIMSTGNLTSILVILLAGIMHVTKTKIRQWDVDSPSDLNINRGCQCHL